MDQARYNFVWLLYITQKKNSIPFFLLKKKKKQAIQQRALRTLKQKRMYEAQITQLSQQTFNMESAALATENLRNTMATVDAMQMANKEMRKQYGKLDVDQIEVKGFCLYERLFFILIPFVGWRIEYSLRYGRSIGTS